MLPPVEVGWQVMTSWPPRLRIAVRNPTDQPITQVTVRVRVLDFFGNEIPPGPRALLPAPPPYGYGQVYLPPLPLYNQPQTLTDIFPHETRSYDLELPHEVKERMWRVETDLIVRP